RAPVPPGDVPRVPVPVPLDAGRPGDLGQPRHPALRHVGLLPAAPRHGAHHRRRRPPVLTARGRAIWAPILTWAPFLSTVVSNGTQIVSAGSAEPRRPRPGGGP